MLGNTQQSSCGQTLMELFRPGGRKVMSEQSVRLGPREKQIVELLLQGCDNAEIAKQLKMARRTVKAHFNRLFLRFGITDGIKRVKLATLLYRRQSCSHTNATETASRARARAPCHRTSRPGLEESRCGRCHWHNRTRSEELSACYLRQARPVEPGRAGFVV